jgi:hypothetical protein
MYQKRLLRRDRPRTVPPQFSWVDHRLVREHRLRDCEPSAWALYLFLVTVADAEGLSFYSDASLSRQLHLDATTLARARQQLIAADLVAYEKPLYQVLGLDSPSAGTPQRTGELRSAGDILRAVLGSGGGLA